MAVSPLADAATPRRLVHTLMRENVTDSLVNAQELAERANDFIDAMAFISQPFVTIAPFPCSVIRSFCVDVIRLVDRCYGYEKRRSAMPEYIVELLVVVEADSTTDAEVLGERAQRKAMQATMPRATGKAKVINVVLADVRGEDG